MEVIIKQGQEQASLLGARIVRNVIERWRPAVLGLATGATPLRLYAELVRMHREEGLSFRDVVTFNLDEYCGLSPDHPASYHAVMCKALFDHVDVAQDATHLPDGNATNVPEACAAYEQLIREAGGIRLQLLGIGHDGHIAFNEPGSSLASRTRIKTLMNDTLHANAGAFGGVEQVPRHAITMGLGTIMEAETCLLLAFGKSKAHAVRGMIEGPVSASCPSSILQHHPKTIVILDHEAASLLEHRQYYLDAYASKPEWQRFE